MNQIEERSLQSVLREKYNIDEPLVAEGRFVSLLGDHGANLVCLGIGIRSLVIAKIELSGDSLDYDLLSITPLSLLSMYYKLEAQKVTITSRYKPTQIFQLCTCDNQTEVWDNFTSVIRDMFQYDRGDGWSSAVLKPAFVPIPIKTEFKHKSSSKENTFLSNRSILDQYLKFSETNTSFTTECLNVQFDSFVNDVQTPSLKEDNFNMSNNIVSSGHTTVTDDTRRHSESKIMKLVRQFVPCWK